MYRLCIESVTFSSPQWWQCCNTQLCGELPMPGTNIFVCANQEWTFVVSYHVPSLSIDHGHQAFHHSILASWLRPTVPETYTNTFGN